MAGPNLYQVTSGERTYAVNLQHRTCGCKKWDMTEVPCNHVISAIHKTKLQPEDFVHDFFTKTMYKAAYSPIIYLVPGPDMWPMTEVGTLNLLSSNNTKAEHRLREERADMRSQLQKTLQGWPQSLVLIATKLAIDTPTAMML